MSKIDYIMVAIYLVAMLGIGIFANRRQKDMTDYYVGGRTKGTFSLIALWVSSWVGGASIIGTATKAYDLGITAAWYVIIVAVACLVFAFTFSKIINRVGGKFKQLTYADFLKTRYDQRSALVASISNIIAMIAFTASQLVAAALMINLILGISMGSSFIIGTIVVVGYTTLGGFNAVTYTDWVQLIIIFIGIVVIGMPLGISEAGGVSILVSKLPESHFDIGAWGWPTLIGLATTMILSFYTSMDSFAKCFAAKDEKTAKRGIIWSAVVLVFIAVAATTLGLVAKVLLPDLGSGDNALTSLVMQIFPLGIRGLIIVGVLAAVMSTADVSVLMGSAAFTNDIYAKYIAKDDNPKKMLRVSILVSLIVGVLGAVMAWKFMDILNILYIAFTITSASLFIPTICAIYYKKANSQASFISMAVSLSVVILWYICGWLNAGAIFTTVDAVWPGLITSALVFFPMCILHKPTEEDLRKAEEFCN